MQTLLSLAAIGAILATAVGLLAPSVVLPGRQSRLTVVLVYLPVILVLGGIETIRRWGLGTTPAAIETQGAEVTQSREVVLMARLKASLRGQNGPLIRATADSILKQFPGSPVADSVAMLADMIEVVHQEWEQRRQVREDRTAMAKMWTYRPSTNSIFPEPGSVASILSENAVEFAFPFDGPQRATLLLRDHPSLGTYVSLRLERGRLDCATEAQCAVSVRFDEGEARPWTGTRGAALANVIFIGPYDEFLKQLMVANVVRIQPEVYQEVRPVFEFAVGGFDPDRYAGWGWLTPEGKCASC